MRFFLAFTVIIWVQVALGQDDLSGPVDSSANVLLKNRYVQFEATQAMFDMYNYDFDKAHRQYNYLRKQYGWHPLPYFLLGLNKWWQLMPYGTQETEWDKPFLAYMDTAEVLAKRLYNEVDEIEGAFFLAAAYAFKGRLYSDRGQYTKAAFVGKNSLKYMEITRGHEDFSPEILFGDGLFNYYAEWIRENYKMLRPLMAFFPEGDKKLGIEQLKETASNAFYSRTEAQYYLMRILYAEEGDLAGAIQISRYLHEQYPNNAYFHRYFTRLLYQSGRYREAIDESLEIINRIDLAMPGYEYNSGRYAGFFLGHAYEIKRDYEQAKKYFNYAIEYGELANAQKMGYYIYSFVHLGRIAMREENYEEAKKQYTRTKKITKRKHPANKEARKRLAEIKEKT